ncbi:DNA-directed DNA polymerase [Tanacetum coccineum]
MKKPLSEDDECYGIDEPDVTIVEKSHVILEDNQSDSSKDLGGTTNQIDPENSEHGNFDNHSSEKDMIRRIDYKDTAYSVEQKTDQIRIIMDGDLCSTSTNEIDEKKPELKDLPSHLEYAYLHGFFQILIAPEDQEKTTFTYLYETFVYKRMLFGLCNAPATFQRCMTAVFHDMVEDFMEVFMDDFLEFDNSFDTCLANLDKMLARCEETNLVLNWEKYHFMVKEGIVLGHKIFGSGIEVDKAKIDVIAKLPYPTNVKGVRSFLGHAGFYRRFIKDFSMISKPMTQLLLKDAKFDFSEECKNAFNTLKKKLTTAPIIISPDWNIPFELMCDARFNIEIKEKKGAENLGADHLSRLENPNTEILTEKAIADEFPDEHLMMLKEKLNEAEPWYTDYINYLVGKVIPLNWTSERRKRFYSQVRNYLCDEPYAFRICPDNIMRRCVAGKEILEIMAHCHSRPTGGHHRASVIGRKVNESGFFWPSIFKDPKTML